MSTTGRYSLVLQVDGNLVEYYGYPIGSYPVATFATETDGITIGRATMHSDGNLVLYDEDDEPRWVSCTETWDGAWVEGYKLVLGNDGLATISQTVSLINFGRLYDPSPADDPTDGPPSPAEETSPSPEEDVPPITVTPDGECTPTPSSAEDVPPQVIDGPTPTPTQESADQKWQKIRRQKARHLRRRVQTTWPRRYLALRRWPARWRLQAWRRLHQRLTRQIAHHMGD